MRFVLREGEGHTARADLAMLAALGLPGGGIVTVGATTVRVVPARMAIANELHLSPDSFANGGVRPGATADVARAVLPPASSVFLERDGTALAEVPRGLIGVPIRRGERYTTEDGEVVVRDLHPSSGAVIGPATVASTRPTPDEGSGTRPPPSASAMIAGLEDELDLLVGWLGLLARNGAVADADPVAGVILTGPAGSGRIELAMAAARAVGLEFVAIDLRTVTTAERLLAKFEEATKRLGSPTLLYIDRLDPLLDRDAGIRHQVAAVTRWMLDSVAEVDGVVVIIASTSPTIGADLDAPDLLRKTLTISAPNHARRRALISANIRDNEDIDLDTLANATPGFSALDISTAVLDARASDEDLTTDSVLEAIRRTTPSLGTMHLGDVPTYGFERVANLVDVKQALTETVIWQLTEPERFARMGIEPARGLLLYGPPGTGKTFVIRALAHESGAAFFAIKGAELLDKWVGESERGVREVFARARAVAPAIIFFDELDALAPVRGASTNNVTDSVVAALLTELDGISSRGDVFVIGATNRRDLIDPALLRPGRLEVQLLLGLPEPDARAAFFEMTSVPLAPDVDLAELVARTEDRSFADLDGLLRAAAVAAMRDDPHASAVTMTHIDTALS